MAPVEIFEPGGSSMNGMNLSGNPGIVQPMQMPHVRTATDTCHPTAFRNVAVNNWSPASQLHDAFRRAIHSCEVTFFVITAAIASLVDRLSKQPRRPASLVEWNHRCESRGNVKQVKHRFHKVVRLDRTTGNVDDRNACLGFPI